MAQWVAQRLDDQDPSMARGILASWVHRKRQSEVTDRTIFALRTLSDEDVVWALNKMAEPKKYIRGRQGQQLNIEMTLGTIDDRRNFPVKALLDSGCTGSCISQRFCEEQGINVRKFPLPIPVYNADGSENAGGAITDFVDLHVKIRDHTERLRFAVTELGKSNVFIGHEWLKFHSPSIDWKAGKIEFTHCPLECTPLLRLSPESEDICHGQ
jgi:gag-polyprotein putative aspartyl protease